MPADLSTIIVPLDGSKNAEHAIPGAITLAKAYSASLEFVHVLDEDDERGAPDASRASELFKAYATGLTAPSDAHETVILHGNPARAILDYANDALAIVLATHDLDVADGLLDEAIFLREGRMVDSLSRPEGLRAAYRRAMTGPSRS